MFRFFLILLACALFWACSSDDSSTLNEWFLEQGFATSYGEYYDEIEIQVKDVSVGNNDSAYMVSSYAAFGNVNDIEQSLYFGLTTLDSLYPVWKLRTDSIFYTDIYNGEVPGEHKKMEARIYWLKENKIEHDTLWLKFQEKFTDSADISIDWKAGGTRDTFLVSLPEELLKLRASSGDTLKLSAYIKSLSTGNILRIAPPSNLDIPGLLRVAQKARVARANCAKCLHGGTRESLSVSFEAGNKIKTDKTVIFAQLVLPKLNDTAGSELGLEVPVHIYGDDGSLENYRVDSSFVKNYGHPNLVFCEGDSLKLQVTNSLRRYAASQPKTLDFTLRLGNPMLLPKSLYSIFNAIYSSDKVFSDRPAYSSYDFGVAFEGKAKLRLWYADFGDKK